MPQLAHAKATLKEPYMISKNVFNALGPLEQLAAKALEIVGDVKIVEDEILHESR